MKLQNRKVLKVKLITLDKAVCQINSRSITVTINTAAMIVVISKNHLRKVETRVILTKTSVELMVSARK